MSDSALIARIEDLEAREDIRGLAHRYAMAVDARDLDTWVNLFVDDVDCGRRGRGRDALKSFIDPALKSFYRSVHHVVGQVIDRLDGDQAEGRVYCRAEDEVGDEWVLQAIVYFDTYERRDGRWFFVRRDEDFYYSADVTERPQDVGFQRWPGLVPRHRFSMMMDRYPSWADFWKDTAADDLARITRLPGPTERDRA